MRSLFLKSRYRLTSHVMLWSSLVHLLSSDCCYTQNTFTPFMAAISVSDKKSPSIDEETKYTVNFNNTSVIEVIRFVSKITGANFVFSENDLQFNVTIVSEEPISAKNFTSALIQVLRVNGLKILEQEGNFLITQIASGVNQISTIVAGEVPGSFNTTAPIVTRVFRIKNANVTNIANIIRPMTSQSSQIEISEQTSQLIITDITTNIDKVAVLLLSLDTPHSNLEIEAYEAKYIYPPDIISLAQQILSPFQEGHPLLFIPNLDNNTIFIISTPHLIERALSVVEDLDVLPSVSKIKASAIPTVVNQNVYIYKILSESSENILLSLQNIDKNISSGTSPKLKEAIQGAKLIQNTQSLIFSTDEATWTEVKTILAGIDIAPYSDPLDKPSFWIYKTENNRIEKIQSSLKKMMSSIQDKNLQKTIDTMNWIPETNSLVFTGPESSIQKLKNILPSLEESSPLHLFVFKIKNAPEAQIITALKQTANAFSDKSLSQAVQDMKWTEGSNSLLFYGTEETIEKLKSILTTLDSSIEKPSPLELYIFKIQKASSEQIISSLKQLKDSIQDKDLSQAINQMKWIESSDSLLFYGTQGTIQKLQNILPTFDIAAEKSSPLQIYIFKIQNTPEKEVISSLKQMTAALQDKDLSQTVANMKWTEGSNSLLFYGTQGSIQKLQNILPTFDSPFHKTAPVELYIFKIQNAPEEQLIASLKQTIAALQDKDLSESVANMKWTEGSHSLLFYGTQSSIQKLQSILTTLDTVAPKTSPLQLFIFKIQNAPEEQLIASLKQTTAALQDKDLSESVANMKWTQGSLSLLFYGTQETIQKLQNILITLDSQKTAPLQLYVFKIQNTPEEQLIASLKQTATALQDKDLSQAVANMEWTKGNNSLLFYGTQGTIQKLQNILTTLDTQKTAPLQLYIFKIQHAQEEQLVASLKQTTETLQDKDLSQAIINMKWTKGNNSLLFYGTQDTIRKLESILTILDVATQRNSPSQLFIFKIKNAPETQIIASLKQLTEVVQDTSLSEVVANMKWTEGSNSLLFYGSQEAIQKLQEILPTLDTTQKTAPIELYIFKIQNAPEAQIVASLKQLTETLQDQELSQAVTNMKWTEGNNSLLFYGTPGAIQKLQNILPTFDVITQKSSPLQLYIFKIQYAQEEHLITSLKQITEALQDKDLSQAVSTMKWTEGSHSLLFYGTQGTVQKLQHLLPTLDTAPLNGPSQFYIYKIQHASVNQIKTSLQELIKTIQDKNLINTIQNMQWIEDSNSLIFNGSLDAITKLEKLLPSLDSTSLVPEKPSDKSQFLIYNPKNQSGEELQKNLKELSVNLRGSGLKNETILSALDSMKWVAPSSLIFTGDPSSLDRIRTILENLDVLSTPDVTLQVFIYKPVYATQSQLQEALAYFAQGLNSTIPKDQTLADAIYKAQWLPESNSFLFKSDTYTLGRLKGVLASIDNPKGLANTYASTFYLYKLQNSPGNIVIQNLKDLSDKLLPEDPNSIAVVKALQSLKWVKENNSILITGSSYAIDQVKSLILDFDTNNHAKTPSPKGDFYIYKSLNKTPKEITNDLSELAKDLSASSFADADLIQTMETARIVTSTKSLLFTGTSDSLAKIKNLLPTIDTMTINNNPIQTIGSTVFFIYKIKKTPAENLIQSLKTFANQLGQAEIEDRELGKCLNSVQYVKETNSLLFTGDQTTLAKAEPLVERFDLGSLEETPVKRENTSTFFVYSPKALPGDTLISILNEFMQNLMTSGISDTILFDSIKHLKFIEKTNSLIISGDPIAIKSIQDLLIKFDISDTTNANPPPTESANFLVYKLQYHSGAEIQTALQKVGDSLNKSSPDANKLLIDAIDSLQWLEITNSLLGTGSPETLTKLKELILSVDVPLRQVFIEVLVVETSLFNSQNFGLQWGTQLQYLNKTVGAMGNLPTTITGIPVQNGASNQNSSGNTIPGTINLAQPLSYTTNLNTPKQGNAGLVNTAIPFATGFDLGVIGDILFHKGKSFISLGSLLNALQVDNDTTVVMNPKIITQDGHTSNIFVGQNIPFVGSFISNTAANTVQSSNIEYRDVGVNLTLTPTLGTNNIITLDIKQDISEQTNNTTQIQGAQVTGIQTSHTTMNTRVHVPDRHFLVLSGMIQDTKVHFRSSIPCLGGLPVIGALFAENDRADTKSNVIIFLRPFIIDSVDDYERLTDAEEALYKHQAGPQDLKEEFDAGVELIKNFNND